MEAENSMFFDFSKWKILYYVEKKRLVDWQQKCLIGLYVSSILTAALPSAELRIFGVVAVLGFFYFYRQFCSQEWILSAYMRGQEDAQGDRGYRKDIHFNLLGKTSVKDWDDIIENPPTRLDRIS